MNETILTISGEEIYDKLSKSDKEKFKCVQILNTEIRNNTVEITGLCVPRIEQ